MSQVSHREQLIEGAISCLQTKGYARTTARDIAAASGANLASIGYHFGSKERLLNEALLRVLRERNRYVGVMASAAEDASPLDRLTKSFEAVRKMFEGHRPLLVAFIEAMAQAERSSDLREQMAANYRDARRGAGELFRESLGAGSKRMRKDPDVLASLLIAAFDGLLIQWLLEPDDTPDGHELIESLAEWMAVAMGADVDEFRVRRSSPRRSRSGGRGRAKVSSQRQ